MDGFVQWAVSRSSPSGQVSAGLTLSALSSPSCEGQFSRNVDSQVHLPQKQTPRELQGGKGSSKDHAGDVAAALAQIWAPTVGSHSGM